MSTSAEQTTRADRTLAFIVANPGATFLEIHGATQNPGGEPTYGSTSRALASLVKDGLIRREREGRTVRSYPISPGAR